MCNLSSQERDTAIEKYWPFSQSFVKRLCFVKNIRDKIVIEDCQQEVAEKGLIKSVDTYDSSKGASLKTWIVSGLRFSFLDYLRVNIYGFIKTPDKRKPLSFQSIKNQETVFGLKDPFDITEDRFKNSIDLSVDGTEQKICNKDMAHKIFSFISLLETQPRARKDIKEIFYLYYCEGYILKEIAEMKGCTKSNISLIIKRTRLKLMEHFIYK